jgi:cyclopropane fatty-acyl-phospholipid synthase-like methyltransferase/methyltransferase-like protein
MAGRAAGGRLSRQEGSSRRADAVILSVVDQRTRMSMKASTVNESASTYDELPYASQFVAAAHPDRLATMAVLHGLTPPPLPRCRVLELGCSDGGNLLTTAQSLPGATFVGVELSSRQVAEGRALIDRLGVTNVTLEERSLMDVDASFGRFDYIVCHGVYSWVPAEVRAKILEICAANLAPHGVAYVSYNTLPGWRLRGMVRDMFQFHAAGFPPGAAPALLVGEVRGLLGFLAASATPADSVYAQALKHEAALLGRSRDTYVFHEHLEVDNHPVYYHEFAAAAAAAGLLPFAPARFDIVEAGLAPEVRQAVARLASDSVRREQYTDFVVNRTFRQTLLVKVGQSPSLTPLPAAVPSLRLTTLARPEAPNPDLRSDAPVGFVSLFGDRLTVGQPLLKAAVVALYERWPRSAGFDDLWAETLARLGRPAATTEHDRLTFATFLLQGHMSNLVNMHVVDPPLAAKPAVRPFAPALIRHKAATGSKVISLRQCAALLDEVDRLLVPLLDGTRDLPALIEAMAAKVADGTLQIHHEGQPVRDLARARELLAEPVERSLWKIAGEALLREN